MTPPRNAYRSVMLALGLGLCASMACFDESVLENEDCESNADCARSQECVRTGYQAGLAENVGWCRPEGEGCAEGLQPGCECEPDGIELCCSGAEVGPLAPFDNGGGSCLCVFSMDMNYPTTPESANGCLTPS